MSTYKSHAYSPGGCLLLTQAPPPLLSLSLSSSPSHPSGLPPETSKSCRLSRTEDKSDGGSDREMEVGDKRGGGQGQIPRGSRKRGSKLKQASTPPPLPQQIFHLSALPQSHFQRRKERTDESRSRVAASGRRFLRDFSRGRFNRHARHSCSAQNGEAAEGLDGAGAQAEKTFV